MGPPEGQKAPLSATCFVVELEAASWPNSPKNQVTSRRPDFRHSGMCDLAARVFRCLYGQIDRPVIKSSGWVKGAVCEHQVGRRVRGRRSPFRPPRECSTDQRASRRAFTKSRANHSSFMPRCPGHMAEVRPIMTGDEWAAAVIDSPPTPDDVTITLDGRRIDSKKRRSPGWPRSRPTVQLARRLPTPLPDQSLPDVRRITEVLDRHGVDYLVIGGVATQAYGAERPTGDFDCLVRRQARTSTDWLPPSAS